MKLDEKDLTTLDELIDICIKSVSTSNFTYIEDSDDLLELKERILKALDETYW